MAVNGAAQCAFNRSTKDSMFRIERKARSLLYDPNKECQHFF